MSYTRREFIVAAYEEIGLADYVFDLDASQIESARRRLDGMMSQWNINGVRIGYPLTADADGSSINDETGVPDWANEAIITNLACRLAPSIGKQLSPDTKIAARKAYLAMLNQCAQPAEMQFPDTLPAGQGRNRYSNYVTPPTDPVQSGTDGELEFN